jgi:predicted phosphohydrolase
VIILLLIIFAPQFPNSYIVAKDYKYIHSTLVNIRSQISNSKHSLFSYIHFYFSLSNLIHKRVMVRGIMVRASFVHPSKKMRVVVREISNLINNQSSFLVYSIMGQRLHGNKQTNQGGFPNNKTQTEKVIVRKA